MKKKDKWLFLYCIWLCASKKRLQISSGTNKDQLPCTLVSTTGKAIHRFWKRCPVLYSTTHDQKRIILIILTTTIKEIVDSISEAYAMNAIDKYDVTWQTAVDDIVQATVTPPNASLSLLTTISNLWSTKQHLSSKTLYISSTSFGHSPSNAILVTLDVSSLYTNIPHNDYEGIDACR